jgi:hypothetical protein
MSFLNAIRWEFLHRVPVIVMLVAAVWYWAQGKRASAIACALGGGVAGPLLVRFSAAMTGGAGKALEATVVNTLTMVLLHLLLVAYLGTEANWSNVKVDLGLGGLAAVCLAAMEGIVAGRANAAAAMWPSIPLGAGGALVLLAIRVVKGHKLALALASAALLGALITVAAGALGFGGWVQ